MEISSTADWQGHLLAFHKLDQTFENDKCRNRHWFSARRYISFGLQQIKLDERAKAHENSDKVLSETGSRRSGNKEIVNENLPGS